MINNSLKLILLSSIALLLNACGGGGDSASTTNQTNPSTQQPVDETTTVRAQPKAVEEINWQSAKIIQTENPMQSSVEVVGSKLSIAVSSQDISEGAHLQIYLNTDNKPETGYQFPNQAWEESGVDFLIEDGDLFQSTQSNSGWNWNVNVGAIDYTLDGDSASANIDLSLLGEICNIIKVGVMTRDEFWDISTFSPASTQMQTFEVSYCNTVVPDTVKPEITLLGANPLNLTVNESFVDPGATASDNIDGDITSSIIALSTVNNTLAGTYDISYSVSDNAGNPANITRVVIVNDIPPPEGIVVDGNTNDWNDIPTFSSSANAIMKVTDDEEKLYILVTSDNLGENIQILMDTDKNLETGLNLYSQGTGWLAGADYMIENNSLDKSKTNIGWSWDYGIAPIEYIKTTNTLEIAIKKSDLNSLGNKVPMGFISRSENWSVNYILPTQAIPVYTMLFENEVNPVEANNDSVTTPNDEAKVINVLANDSSLDNSTLTIGIATQPETGAAVVTQNNRVRYTPEPSFTGTVSFTYQISDLNGNTDIASINVIVTAPANIAPVANNDAITTQEDTPVNIRAILNDTDANDDVLTITNVTNPSNGTAVIVNNTVTYTPSAGFSGTDSFNYTISDGNSGSDTATITVTIEDTIVPPPIAENDVISTQQNQQVIVDVLDNDSGVEAGITLTISAVSNPNNGTATIVNNKVRYIPANNFIGTDTFTYTISNGNDGTDTATITVTVTALPNNPPVANNDSATTDGIKTKQISVLVNDTDADGDTLQIVGFTQPSNGSISLTTATATFNYTPNATFSGTDTFTYRISDGNVDSNTATVTVTVPPNNFPDAVEDNGSVNFDETITINVLNNDTDPDNDVLSVLSIVQPSVGVATLNANGTIFFDPQNNVGSISIGYTVSDGRGGTDFAILTVSSTDPNNGNFGWPVIVDENVTTISGTAVFVDVLANDSDPDGDTLILDQLSGADNGTAIKINGGIRYTPDPGFVGTDFVYYGVHDGFGHNGFGTITITVTPNAPQ